MNSTPSSIPESLLLSKGDDDDHRSPFLTSEERYEVYEVKAAERPWLLLHTDNQEDKDPPLIDGCDIPGWRRERIVPLSSEIQAILNVGAGCSLLRRESIQWPALPPIRSGVWEELCTKLYRDPQQQIPRVDCEDMASVVETEEGVQSTRFAIEWERRNVPVLVENCTRGWKAMPRYSEGHKRSFWNGGGEGGWTFEQLLARFSNVAWRFSDTHGEMMSLHTYAKYIANLEGLTDDSPLAIYDSEFGDDDSPTHVLLDEYTVPPCFSPDLFELADCKERPPYRWILIGPARSGTGLHIDPLWTNAWVTVLQGCKRWMLFPPATPPKLIGMDGPYQIPSVVWFRDYYEKVTSGDWPAQYRPVECLQRPGETVFVPNGWPHLVLNLELTVAVTHNYASEFGPFERMWMEVVAEEPEFFQKWHRGLEEKRPDLAQRLTDSLRASPV